jgi:flavin reductase (DIM6/NTAB) family NADH-FMN oxidoreductase RutF
MKTIEINRLSLIPFEILDDRWGIVVSGLKKPNPMTVSWGSFGTIWDKPVVTVYVRPTRFSHKLLMEHDEFTLNILPATFKKALQICGTLSGKNVDKWEESTLTTAKSSKIKTPRVKEAELVFECKTVARVQMDKKDFLDPKIVKFYPKKDYHTLLIGEVLRIFGEEKLYETKL